MSGCGDRQMDDKLRSIAAESRPLDMLLAVLSVFFDLGRNEVSLSEFQESIALFQQRSSSLRYSFSGRFPISPDLLADLTDLRHLAYIRDYHYRLDNLLPKHFLNLTVPGRGKGKRRLEELDADTRSELVDAVKAAMINYKERWRLWARPTT